MFAAIALAGLLLALVGVVLAFAYMFPETTCTSGGSDVVCLIGPNPLALPTLIGGMALAIAAVAAHRVRQRAATPPKG